MEFCTLYRAAEGWVAGGYLPTRQFVYICTYLDDGRS